MQHPCSQKELCSGGELYCPEEGNVHAQGPVSCRVLNCFLFCQAANSGVSGLPASHLPPEDGGRPTECSVRTADPHSAAVSTLLPWEGYSQPHNHPGTNRLSFVFWCVCVIACWKTGVLDHGLAAVPTVFLEWYLLRNWQKDCPEEHILLQLRGAKHGKPIQGHAVRKQLSNLESPTWCKFLFVYCISQVI